MTDEGNEDTEKVIRLFANGKAGMCTANRKKGRGRCKNVAVKGTKVCRMHGGTQPKGMDSPQFKHGGRVRPQNRGFLIEQLDAADRQRMDEYRRLAITGEPREVVKALTFAMLLRFAENSPDSYPAMASAYASFMRADKEVHEGITSNLHLNVSLEEWRKNGPKSLVGGTAT